MGSRCTYKRCVARNEVEDHEIIYHIGNEWNNVKLKHENGPCSPFVCPLCPPGETEHWRYSSKVLLKILSQHGNPEIGRKCPDTHLITNQPGQKPKAGKRSNVVIPSQDGQQSSSKHTTDSAIDSQGNPTSPESEPKVPGRLESRQKHTGNLDYIPERVVLGNTIGHLVPDEEPASSLPTKSKEKAGLRKPRDKEASEEQSSDEEASGEQSSDEEASGEQSSDEEASEEQISDNEVELFPRIKQTPLLPNKGKRKAMQVEGVSLPERQTLKVDKPQMVHPSLFWDRETNNYTYHNVSCSHEVARCALLECFNMFLIPSLKAIGLCSFPKGKRIQRVIGLDEIVEQWAGTDGVFPMGFGSRSEQKSKWANTIILHLSFHHPGFHSQNSDVKNFINQHDIVLQKPVEGFEIKIEPSIQCPRCEVYYAVGASIRTHYNQNCRLAVTPGFPQSISSHTAVQGSDLFCVKYIQVIGKSLKIPVTEQDRLAVQPQIYEKVQLPPRNIYTQQICPKGFPVGWFDWLKTDVGINFTLSPESQKQGNGFFPELVMFLLGNPSLKLVAMSEGEAQVRERICYQSSLFFQRYLIDAGEKAEQISNFPEMMQSSSNMTWRNFKNVATYLRYRIAFTNLITAYLRWKTTDLKKKLPLNVPKEVEKAFLPLLQMIQQQHCGTVDELAPIVHNIVVKIILTEQSIKVKTPLFMEQIVALQSIEHDHFKAMNQISSLCAMMMKSIGSSVLLSAKSGGFGGKYSLPDNDKAIEPDTISEEEKRLFLDEEQDSDSDDEDEETETGPSGYQGVYNIAQEVPLQLTELDELEKIPSSSSQNAREFGELLMETLKTAMPKNHLVSALPFSAISKAWKGLYSTARGEPGPMRVEISSQNNLTIRNVNKPDSEKQFSLNKLREVVQELVQDVKTTFEAFIPLGTLNKLTREYKIEKIEDNAGDELSLFLRKDNQIYFQQFSDALEKDLNLNDKSFDSKAAWKLLEKMDCFADALVVQLFYITGIPPRAWQAEDLVFGPYQGLFRMFKKLENHTFILCQPKAKQYALQESFKQYGCVWGLPDKYVWYLTISVGVVRTVQMTVLDRLKSLEPRLPFLHSHIFVRVTNPHGQPPKFTYSGVAVNKLLKQSPLKLTAGELRHIFIAISQQFFTEVTSTSNTSTSVTNLQAQHPDTTGNSHNASNSYLNAPGHMQTEIVQMITLSYNVQCLIGVQNRIPTGYHALGHKARDNALQGLLEAQRYVVAPFGYHVTESTQRAELIDKCQQLQRRKPYLFGQNCDPSQPKWQLKWTELGDECLTKVAVVLADGLNYDKSMLVATSVYMIEMALEKVQFIDYVPLKIETNNDQAGIESQVIGLVKWFEDNHAVEWNKFWKEVDHRISNSSPRQQDVPLFSGKHGAFPPIPTSSQKS
ncbi:hypothetical protein BDP27DRAFT_1403849 [Rhodocollybia butyracea]|uniref:Uncharacterized protein n=1 Tax=Rhodocollybia butyracea TaxID=206335 RepID=A0A9P5PQ56_9AGAR|nr:hypothetical protein BDP27DRAFT_1403849 [Rhodocollybia butyracea]